MPMLSLGHPTVFENATVTYRPVGAQADALRAIYSYSHPPPAASLRFLPSVVSLSRRWRRRLRFASLRSSSAADAACLRSPVAYARRRRNPAGARHRLAPASQPSLTLRASRPPSIGSSSFFCLVYFCFFRCVILSRIVPCGSWLRCYRPMALRLRVGFVPRLRVWMRVASVPV